MQVGWLWGQQRSCSNKADGLKCTNSSTFIPANSTIASCFSSPYLPLFALYNLYIYYIYMIYAIIFSLYIFSIICFFSWLMYSRKYILLLLWKDEEFNSYSFLYFFLFSNSWLVYLYNFYFLLVLYIRLSHMLMLDLSILCFETGRR